MITVSKVITHVALVQKWVNDLLTRPLSEGVVGRSHMKARAEGGSRERIARSDPVIILMTPISYYGLNNLEIYPEIYFTKFSQIG
jgi:hypothetical protein